MTLKGPKQGRSLIHYLYLELGSKISKFSDIGELWNLILGYII